MDFKREQEPLGSRPAVVQQQPTGAGLPARSAQKHNDKKQMIWGGIALLALVGIIAACSFLFLNKDQTGIASTEINKDKYQAVFLTNGQVYFGKLQSTRGDYLSLENIYYLQVAQAIQPGNDDDEGEDEAAPANVNSGDNSDVQLIKLGNELHGPEDQMQITKDQVLFWENLKADGKVAKAIDSYVKE